jgi:phage terminase small subunit
MGKAKLSNTQKVWLEYYFICNMNATEAARRAGYAYPNKSGPENLQKPHIQELIEARIKELAMSANETLYRLATHARGNVGDFEDETGAITRESLKKAKENGLDILIKKIIVERRTIEDSETDTAPIVSEKIVLELHDAQAALVHIGRYHKLFTDKVEHSVDEEQLGRVDKLKSLFQDMRQREAGHGHSETD